MEGELLRLGRPPHFEGREEEWTDWTFQAKAFLSLVGDSVGQDLENAALLTVPVNMADMTETRQTHSRKVFYMLTMLLKGPPLSLLRQVPDSNGYDAWRQLHRRYDSNQAGRQHAMLGMILRPKPFPANALAWEDALAEWKRLIERWQTLSGESLPQSVKLTVLLENAPPAIKSQLTLQNYTSAADLEQAVLSYLGVQRFLNGTSNDMEVDAISKGRGKGKNKKGRGKGKDKGEAKGKDDANKPRDGEQKETRTCRNCGRTGHLAAQCWRPGGGQAKGKGKGDVNIVYDPSVPNQQGGAPSTISTSASSSGPSISQAAGGIGVIESIVAEKLREQGWINNIAVNTLFPCGPRFLYNAAELMIDSGASVHVCPINWWTHCSNTDVREDPFKNGRW